MAMNFNTRIDPAIAASIRDETATGVSTAQDSAALSAVGEVGRWVDSEMKNKAIEDRQIRAEGRAEEATVRKEKRQTGVLEGERAREDKLLKEQRAYDEPTRQAQIAKMKAEERKADRWVSSSDAVKKKYLSESDAIDYKTEAKQAYEEKRADLRDKKGIIWDTDTEVYAKGPTGEEVELSVQEALDKVDREEAEFNAMIDSKTQLGAPTTPSKTSGLTPAQKKRRDELRAKLGK